MQEEIEEADSDHQHNDTGADEQGVNDMDTGPMEQDEARNTPTQH